MTFVELCEDFFLVCFVFIATWVDFGDEAIEVGIGSEGALGDEFFTAGWTFFVARAECGDDAVAAEAMKTLLGCHGLFEHVEANRTPGKF